MSTLETLKAQMDAAETAFQLASDGGTSDELVRTALAAIAAADALIAQLHKQNQQ